MTKKVQAVKATPIEAVASLVVDQKSMIDIQVAAAEDFLVKKQNRLEKEIDVIDEKINKNSEALDILVQKVADSKKAAFSKGVIKPLKGLGLKVTTEVTAHTTRDSANRLKVTLNYSIKMDQRRAHNTGTLKSEKTVAAPKAAASLDKKASALGSERSVVKDSLMRVKHQLSNITRMERRAKANLAIEVLKSTPEGKAMLANLNTPTALLTDGG